MDPWIRNGLFLVVMVRPARGRIWAETCSQTARQREPIGSFGSWLLSWVRPSADRYRGFMTAGKQTPSYGKHVNIYSCSHWLIFIYRYHCVPCNYHFDNSNNRNKSMKKKTVQITSSDHFQCFKYSHSKNMFCKM